MDIVPNNGLIPVEVDQNGQHAVSGRALHEFLEVTTAYNVWIARMIDYGFADGTDFQSFLIESSGGRPSTDHALTIDMAKELSMIQRTPKGKQAREYFIDVEKRFRDQQPRELSGAELMARALVEAQSTLEARDARILELEAPASAWNDLASAKGDYSVGDAAKVLSRAGIKTGEQRLFNFLGRHGWLYRRGDGRWSVYQRVIEQGLASEKPMPPRYHPVTGEKILPAPQPRITIKGVEKLRSMLGNELGEVA